MRLARTNNPVALFQTLRQIDATRAPLHPLLLRAWVGLFGPSDRSGRAFSVLCGVVAVGLVYGIGLRAFDRTTALWACWLCALSPLLVYYSREARMYMWLTTITCVAWYLLFSLSTTPRRWRLVLYGLSLIAIVYSHPLGLLMVGTLGLASGIFHRAFRISGRAWLYTHLAVALAVAPWVGQYLDHAPESTSGLLPPRYLLGMPIGFIGGNFAVLFFCCLLIVYGLLEVRSRKTGSIRIGLEHLVSSICLLLWLILPPVLLYIYSRIAYPIFGPPRYTLFVSPAYLLLVARGLGKLPWALGTPALATGIVLSGVMLYNEVYRRDLKADWRGAATFLGRRDPTAMVVLIASGPSGDTELKTARYYFGPSRIVIPWCGKTVDLLNHPGSVWISISLKDARPVDALPAVLTKDHLIREVVDFSGLRLMLVDFRQASRFGE